MSTLTTQQKSDIDKLWTEFWTGGITNPLTVIEQISFLMPDKIWRVVPRASVATAPYLRFLLAHDRFRGELTKTATGTSGSMLNVSMEKLRSLNAPLPTVADQNRFAEVVWSVLRAKGRHERAQAATQDLFKSLAASAFEGRQAS